MQYGEALLRQSAISDFDEYTILWPGPFAQYTGLSESEVRTLCDEQKMDFWRSFMRLLSGEAIPVDVEGFENDFESFRTKDDVLTLLIHLGYLTWDGKKGVAKKPNEEVRREFKKIRACH